jgi:hypothetical protein
MATISYAKAGPSRLSSLVPSIVSRALPRILQAAVTTQTFPNQSISSVTSGSLADSGSASIGTQTIRGLVDSLVELFPPFLLAVPKKKVSHSRKSMRSAHKGLKNKTSQFSLWPLLYTGRLNPVIILRDRYILMPRMRGTQTVAQPLFRVFLTDQQKVILLNRAIVFLLHSEGRKTNVECLFDSIQMETRSTTSRSQPRDRIVIRSGDVHNPCCIQRSCDSSTDLNVTQRKLALHTIIVHRSRRLREWLGKRYQ